MDSQTLAYLRSLQDRLAVAQLLASGTLAWGAISRLRDDVRHTIEQELQQRENDYVAEEEDFACQKDYI